MVRKRNWRTYIYAHIFTHVLFIAEICHLPVQYIKIWVIAVR